MEKFFSIIIPVHNAESKIKKTLNSIIAQSINDYECIIMDGESTDKTLDFINDYVNKYPNIKCFSQRDSGIYDAMNNGVERATGKYVIFMGAGDVLFDNNVLECVMRQIKCNSRKDVYYGYVMYDYEGKLEKYDKRINCMYTILVRPVSHQAIFSGRNVFDKVKFDCHYRVAADQDWIIRVYKNKFKIQYLNTPIVIYDTMGESSSEKGKIEGTNEIKESQRRQYPIRAKIHKILATIKNGKI